MNSQIFTLEQLADQFNVQKSSVMRWLRLGVLPAQRVEDGYSITPADFETFFDSPDGQALAMTMPRLMAEREARKKLGQPEQGPE